MSALFREESIAHRTRGIFGETLDLSGRRAAPLAGIAKLDLAFFGRRRVPVILQAEAAECGLACLAMVAGFHGFETDLAALRRRWSVSLKGVNLAQLIAMAQDLKLAPRALRLDLEDLGQLKAPAILHWDLDHFVVLERVSGKGAWIVDPALGRRLLAVDEVSRHFTGVALELVPAADFERRREAAALPLSAFFHGATGLGSTLVRILALSVALQVFVLLAPLFGQIVLDEIVVSGDRDLLTVVAVAFLLLALIQVSIAGIRSWLVIALGASLQFGWSARLFHHLLRLPLPWFEKRHVGDVVSRFGSVRAVEGLVANTVVEAIVDGLMAVTTLAVMLIYSVELTALVLAAVLAYALVRALLFHPLRAVAHEALMLGAREHSTFLESVRAILPLKNFGREASREAVWQNRKAEALNAEIRDARLRLVQQMANGAIFAVENIAVLWLGALAIIGGDLSIGMLVAFIAYKNQFGGRAVALIDKAIQYRLTGVHLDRIADIALAERDPGTEGAPPPARPASGALETRDLHFRYADTEPFVLAGVDLKIEPGECVAIAAPSGTGKTTLLKLMMGLLTPTSGEVVMDGIGLQRGALAGWRHQVAAVMQDDALLSGTLAENVACFDPAPDQRRLDECAKLAAIDEDIARMPMGWQTLVGDMGNTLSGGQRQRILLARALYAEPRVLFLDEATSHLDPATEARIHEALRAMRITRVLVAHRQETLAIADRIVNLSQATCIPRPRYAY